jgi:K+ transporter
MKKSLTLVEVLISVMLISVVITAMLQIKNNNLIILKKVNDTIQNNSYVNLLAFDKINNNQDTKIYLDEQINFKDDNIRKKLKTIKVTKKTTQEKPIILKSDDYKLTIMIYKTTLAIEDKITTNYYRFSLEQ